MQSREARPFDIIIFGASGYTGTYVLEELVKHGGNIKYAIAGRSRKKLESVLEYFSSVYRDVDKSLCFENVEIIIADVGKTKTISDMCMKTKLVIDCVGPFNFFGEPVVKECVKNFTHYIDVSGEPLFLERMQLKYFEEAKTNEIYVVGACGFDSVPCDLGVEVLKDRFSGDINFVETYLKISTERTGANFATWQSAIYGLANASELKPLRKELKKTLFKKTIPKSNFPAVKRSVLFKKNHLWCIPFVGSDKSIVTRTQFYNYEFGNHRPVQIQTYLYMPSFFYALAALFLGLIFLILTKFTYGRHLLENYPEFFSAGMFTKATPKREEPASGGFSITFEAQGWSEKLEDPSDQHTSKPDKNLKAIFNFPDGCYISTAVCVVSCALVLLEESIKMPEKGGVFTPAAAFKDTSLLQRLEARVNQGKSWTATGVNFIIQLLCNLLCLQNQTERKCVKRLK